jgi:hypothetical protein
MTGLPKYLKFYVDNFADISAAIQLDRTSRKNLPESVIKILEAVIVANISRWTLSRGGRPSFAHHKNEEGVTWWDPSWMIGDQKDKEDCGAYLGVYQLTSYNLIDAVETSERPFLYLYCHKKYRGLNKVRLRAAFQKNRGVLPHLGFPTNIDGDDGFIITQSLADVVSLERLVDLPKLEKNFLARAKKFSEAIAPIVSKIADGA